VNTNLMMEMDLIEQSFLIILFIFTIHYLNIFNYQIKLNFSFISPKGEWRFISSYKHNPNDHMSLLCVKLKYIIKKLINNKLNF
jgi:hypothetical protein